MGNDEKFVFYYSRKAFTKIYEKNCRIDVIFISFYRIKNESFQVASACSAVSNSGGSCSSITWKCGDGSRISIPRTRIGGDCLWDFTSEGLQRYVFDGCGYPSNTCRNHPDWQFQPSKWCSGVPLPEYVESACLSHDQCYSYTGGSPWMRTKRRCDLDQMENGIMICKYLRGVWEPGCNLVVSTKMFAHDVINVSESHYKEGQQKGCS